MTEHEKRLDRKAGDALNGLALRVGLLEKSGVDEHWIDPAAVGFRFDCEQSARPDENVIDVAVTRRRVVDCQPAVGAQAVDVLGQLQQLAEDDLGVAGVHEVWAQITDYE